MKQVIGPTNVDLTGRTNLDHEYGCIMDVLPDILTEFGYSAYSVIFNYNPYVQYKNKFKGL